MPQLDSTCRQSCDPFLVQECLEGRRVDPSPPSMEANQKSQRFERWGYRVTIQFPLPRKEAYTTSLDASSSPADFEVRSAYFSSLHFIYLIASYPPST